MGSQYRVIIIVSPISFQHLLQYAYDDFFVLHVYRFIFIPFSPLFTDADGGAKGLSLQPLQPRQICTRVPT